MTRETYDCDPSLGDREVLAFCRSGFLVLEGVVPAAINRRTTDFLETNTHYEPTEILEEEWFVEGVILNREAAGAIRSLLGRNFHLPVLMSNHRVTAPAPAIAGWHVDGNSQWGAALNYLQVFYYPQETPLALGPTELLPGSHLVFNQQRAMAHLGNLRGVYRAPAPAGTIVVTAYPIWHRRGNASGTGLRNLLKYFYWRTESPRRDWIREPEFDFATVDFQGSGLTFGEQFYEGTRAAEIFCWLCGKHDRFQVLGGQSWPLPAKRLAAPYGFPEGLERDRDDVEAPV
jgi:hypothetical protein